MSMITTEPLVNDNAKLPVVDVRQAGHPALERAVDEPVPIAPPANNQPLLSNNDDPDRETIQHRDLEGKDGIRDLKPRDGISQIRKATHTSLNQTRTSSSSIDDSSHSSRLHLLDTMHSALMDSLVMAVRTRHPDLAVERDKLIEKFSQKLTNSEVQDFMRKGRDVVDHLKRSGKLDEVKRKLASQTGKDETVESRSVRQRISRSISPHIAENSQVGDHQDLPPSQYEHSSFDGTAKTPRATPTNQWTVPLFSAVSDGPEGPSTSVHGDLRHESSSNAVSMSVSPTPQRRSESPRSRQTSMPSSANQANTELHIYETEDEFASVARVVLPSDVGVPRILLAKVGRPTADLLEASFEMDERVVDAARRWAERSKHFDPSRLHMRVYLTSITIAAAEKAHHEIPPNSSPSLLAEAVSQIEVVWPPPGTLYVSLNEQRPEATSWAGHCFGDFASPLDISHAVVPGTNNIRLIQLADHSQQLFLIIEAPPSELEKQRRIKWNTRFGEHMAGHSVKVLFRA